MKFCNQCGNPVEEKVPHGDDRLRFVCSSCQTIHYQNPRIVVGTLPIHGDKILLCRRAIEPQKGLWTLPAGFMENGETTLEGALRESWEEACAQLDDVVLYRLFDLPHINQVYMFYAASLRDGKYGVGSESSEVRLFDESDIPWDELAFPVVKQALEDFFADRREGRFQVRISKAEPLR